MTSVNALFSGSYYQLPDQNAAANAAGQATPASAASIVAAAQPTGGNVSYLLNLSPQAQAYLSSLDGSTPATPAAAPDDSKFLLTGAQQAQINAILAKYKDAPYDQDTYQNIQSDLADAGLSADALAAKDKARSINPTQMLIDMLNGKDSAPVDPTANDGALQKKADNYMGDIMKKWGDISTTKDTEDASA